MEINHLREFVIFAETMNYTVAAKKLFIAKSTLMQHIRAIEKELGFPLVDRNAPRNLTKGGDRFLFQIQKMLADYDDIVASCLAEEGELSQNKVRLLGIPSDGCLPEKLDNLEFVEDLSFYNYSELEVLDKGKADVSFHYSANEAHPELSDKTHISDYEIIPLKPIRCVFIMSSQHPLAQYAALADAPARKWPLAQTGSPIYASGIKAISKILDSVGFAYSVFTVRPNKIINYLVSENDSLCVAFKGAVDDILQDTNPEYVIIKEFEDAPVIVYPFALCRKDNPNPAVHDFMVTLAKP